MTTALPIFFHIGRDLNLKTIAKKGEITVSGSSLNIWGKGNEIVVPYDQLKSIELIRHSVGSVIKLGLGSEYVFLAVTRFMIGQFALINYRATMRLFEAISELSPVPAKNDFPPRRRRNHLLIFAISAAAAFSVVALLNIFAAR
ncbi:hypothetical protein [Rhizobium ecuadorense]|uniref:hypothetical protein n=1 Tax=Rhizobium ecuadorense TaxID=1671795 RepID=UPI000673225C|nr:hypothetical protein [Rhizobium ecuadorense]